MRAGSGAPKSIWRELHLEKWMHAATARLRAVSGSLSAGRGGAVAGTHPVPGQLYADDPK